MTIFIDREESSPSPDQHPIPLTIRQNHTMLENRMNNERPLEHNRAMTPGPSKAIEYEVARLRSFEALQFQSKVLYDAQVDLFCPMQMPIGRIERNRNHADESGSAIHTARKHRAIDARAFDASHVMVRSSKPGTGDCADVRSLCLYFTRWPDHPILHIAVSGAGTYGNPPKFTRFENFPAHVAGVLSQPG